MKWNPVRHGANGTREYLFHQLIPYIGNKRKLLGLVSRALEAAEVSPETHLFVDMFSGSGVVGRLARQRGYAVLANDWEPYSTVINRCYLGLSRPPSFFDRHSYEDVLAELNALPPLDGWVTTHLCPRDDDAPAPDERLFYTRRNGMRIDAIRERIALWQEEGALDDDQSAALLAPLLYQCCYNANTSGVFKGFHNGWGGQTKTALYRIKGDLILRPALFFNNGKTSRVMRLDAAEAAEAVPEKAFVYLDPPYNQHPYGSNYHVLNSVALWDKPPLSPRITGRGDKAAIRTDWRIERRSAYNHAADAALAYKALVAGLAAEWTATSYSTEGMIPLREMLAANLAVGDVRVFPQAYKRYRVSSQRYSEKPTTVEFVVLTKRGEKARRTLDDLVGAILKEEKT